MRRLIGLANYVELSRPGWAEIAVVVAHEQHARGVGTALLHALGRIARSAGQHRFIADVLFENYAMRQVIKDAGWPVTQHRDGPVVSIELDLDHIDVASSERRTVQPRNDFIQRPTRCARQRIGVYRRPADA